MNTNVGPARTIPVCQQNGGVGKTTNAKNLAAALAHMGRTVLLVDWDAQGALTVRLGIDPIPENETNPEATLARAVLGKKINGHEIDPTVLPYQINENLDIIPASTDLVTLGVELKNMRNCEQRLCKVLKVLVPYYDDIIIDCEPHLGVLTDSAIFASDDGHGNGCYIQSVKPQPTIESNMQLLDEQIGQISEALERPIHCLATAINDYSVTRGNPVREAFAMLESMLEGTTYVNIPFRAAIQYADKKKVTVFGHDPNSAAAQFYIELAVAITPELLHHPIALSYIPALANHTDYMSYLKESK